MLMKCSGVAAIVIMIYNTKGLRNILMKEKKNFIILSRDVEIILSRDLEIIPYLLLS